MAPFTKPAVAAESNPSSPELETTNPTTQSSTLSLESRVELLDKEMAWIKEAVGQILRNQIYGPPREGREMTPMGFTSPVTGVQLMAPSSPLTVSDRNVSGGLLPLPITETRTRPMEFLHGRAEFDQRIDPPRSVPDLSTKQLELPMFEGYNPEDWIFRVEKCFIMNRTQEDEKLEQALACLTGSAVTWWRISQKREKIVSWKEFKEKFKIRFKPSRGSSLVDHLLNITQ